MLIPLAGTQPSVSVLRAFPDLLPLPVLPGRRPSDPINSAASPAQAPVTYGSAPLDPLYSPNLTSKFLAVGGASHTAGSCPPSLISLLAQDSGNC